MTSVLRPTGAADTTMMGAVHDALRRDHGRPNAAVGPAPRADTATAQNIGRRA